MVCTSKMSKTLFAVAAPALLQHFRSVEAEEIVIPSKKDGPHSIGFILHGLGQVADDRIDESNIFTDLLGYETTSKYKDSSNYSFHRIEYVDTVKFPTEEKQRKATLFGMTLQDQVANACKEIVKAMDWEMFMQSDKDLVFDNVALVGHSNGGIVGRAVVQNCDLPNGNKFTHFVSVAGPLRGIGTLPQHLAEQMKISGWVLNIVNAALRRGAVLVDQVLGHNLGPAGYFYNPFTLDKYHDTNTFRMILDNMAPCSRKNDGSCGQIFKSPEEQKRRITDLKGAFLLRATQDQWVKPEESQWLGEVRGTKSGLFGWKTQSTTIPLEKTGEFWDNDLVGFKALHEAGRLFFYWSKNHHDNLDGDLDREERKDLVAPFLANDMDFTSKWNTAMDPTHVYQGAPARFTHNDVRNGVRSNCVDIKTGGPC